MSNSPLPQYYEEAYALQQHTKELHSEIRRLYDQNSQLRKTNASLYEAYIGVIQEIKEICSDPEIPVLRNSFPPILPPPFLRSSGTNQEYIEILKGTISDLYSKNEKIYFQNERLDKARRDAQQILKSCRREQQPQQMSQDSSQYSQQSLPSSQEGDSQEEAGYMVHKPNSKNLHPLHLCKNKTKLYCTRTKLERIGLALIAFTKAFLISKLRLVMLCKHGVWLASCKMRWCSAISYVVWVVCPPLSVMMIDKNALNRSATSVRTLIPATAESQLAQKPASVGSICL
jgi:hypothetical protein